MEEIWKDIEGYEGYYEVSNLGNVKNARTGTILKGNMNSGYLRITVRRDGKQKNITIHRAVLTAFVENTKGLPQINHIDHNTRNNRLDNLEWCTSEHNCKAKSQFYREKGFHKNGSKFLDSKKERLKYEDSLRKLCKCGKKMYRMSEQCLQCYRTRANNRV